MNASCRAGVARREKLAASESDLCRAPGRTRVWVRKYRPEFGWTLNFAHTASWWWAGAILALPAAAALMGFFR